MRQEIFRYRLQSEVGVNILLCDRAFRPNKEHSLLSQSTPHKHKSDYLLRFQENYEIMTLLFPRSTYTTRNLLHTRTDNNFLKPTGYVMHQQFNIQHMYALPTLYLCVLYLSENKQRLVPITA